MTARVCFGLFRPGVNVHAKSQPRSHRPIATGTNMTLPFDEALAWLEAEQEAIHAELFNIDAGDTATAEQLIRKLYHEVAQQPTKVDWVNRSRSLAPRESDPLYQLVDLEAFTQWPQLVSSLMDSHQYLQLREAFFLNVLPTARKFAGLRRKATIMMVLFATRYLGLFLSPDALRRLHIWSELFKACFDVRIETHFSAARMQPLLLKVNERGQFHAEGGPAVVLDKSNAYWFLNGVEVDRRTVLEPEKQSLVQIDSEFNEERRRLRIERLAGASAPSIDGWQRYLEMSKATLISSRLNVTEQTREALFQTPTNQRLFVCHCPSTGRIYALHVPRSTRTCQAAQEQFWSGSTIANQFDKPFNIIGRT